MGLELQALLSSTFAGGIVQVPSGHYAVNLVIQKPVTLIALGEVVFDGGARGPVLRIEAPSGLVRVQGVLFANGLGLPGGGGLSLTSECSVELQRCTFRFNRAPMFGGGGLFASSGSVVARACRFEGNTGRQGGAVLVDGTARLELEGCALTQNAATDGGAVRLLDGCEALVSGCTFSDNRVVSSAQGADRGATISMSGTATRAPRLKLIGSVFTETKPTGQSEVASVGQWPGLRVP